MLSKDQVLKMFQKVYFDSIDRNDMEKAVSIFDEDVEWIHTQVFEHDDYPSRTGSDTLKGRKAMELLKNRVSDVFAKLKVFHVIEDLLFEVDRGAFRGWVELRMIIGL